MNKDILYSKPKGSISNFVFDDQVADVFDDMIQRSVPGYAAVITMIGILASQYVKSKTQCYDLGCSLGAATVSMASGVKVSEVKIIAIDNSAPMVEKAKKNVETISRNVEVELKTADIRDVKLVNASMAVLNFTLQFIEPQNRRELLEGIYSGMNEGGVLVISDKITFENTEEDQYQTELYHTFKKLNGYSDLEIAQKRSALENVLIPDTLETHHQRLKDVGFKNSSVWFQCFNFASIIAIK